MVATKAKHGGNQTPKRPADQRPILPASIRARLRRAAWAPGPDCLTSLNLEPQIPILAHEPSVATIPSVSASDSSGVIRATGEHRFYVKGRGWVMLKDLLPGDSLRTPEGNWMKVQSTRQLDRCEPVFNICVESAHTYFVLPSNGSSGVLVHNDSVQTAPPAIQPGQTVPGAPTVEELEAMYNGKPVNVSPQAKPQVDESGNPALAATIVLGMKMMGDVEQANTQYVANQIGMLLTNDVKAGRLSSPQAWALWNNLQ